MCVILLRGITVLTWQVSLLGWLENIGIPFGFYPGPIVVGSQDARRCSSSVDDNKPRELWGVKGTIDLN